MAIYTSGFARSKFIITNLKLYILKRVRFVCQHKKRSAGFEVEDTKDGGGVRFTGMYSMYSTLTVPCIPRGRGEETQFKYVRVRRVHKCGIHAHVQPVYIPFSRCGKIYIEFNEFRDRIVLIKKGNEFSAICIRYSILLHSSTTVLPYPFFFFISLRSGSYF